MSEQPSASDLYRAAQVLIKEGNPVFPCRSAYVDEKYKEKQPLIKNGVLAATLDISQAKTWWKQWRTASIGIATGYVWDVLDVDTKDGRDGRVHLPYLHRLGLLDGCQKIVRTPSGGWHLYFKTAPGLINTNKAARDLGMDVRGKGGYVLASPSYLSKAVTASGKVYSGHYEEIEGLSGSSDSPLLWDLIAATLAPVNTSTKRPVELLPSERRSSIAALREWVSIRGHGERNTGLHWAVCRCIDNGIDPNELIEPAMLTGLGEEEIQKTINSALKRAGVMVEDLDSEAEAMFPETE